MEKSSMNEPLNTSEKVVFLFDENRDEYNVWNTCRDSIKYNLDFAKGINPELKEITKGKTFEECKNKIAEINSGIYNSPLIPMIIKNTDEAWKLIEKEYIKRMENMTGKPFYPKEIRGYITTIKKCPYNAQEGTFMFNAFAGILNTLEVVGHELFHLQFHEYFFGDIEKEIGYKNAHDLKEALTVLLNLEFMDLWFIQDKGYKVHEPLRNFIVSEWQKEKNFDKLLEKCKIYIKELKGGDIE